MSSVINQESVLEMQSLMGDKFSMMIEYFLEDSATYIQEMEKAVQEKNAEHVKAPAHTIKSSANQLGADKVSNLAKEIEELADIGLDSGQCDFERVGALYADLKEAFLEAEPELKKML